MSLIAYAMAGEGRGHAARAKTVTDELLARGHSVVFMTGDDALAFLKECYPNHPRIHFVEIPVLRFTYTRRGKIKRINPYATVRDVVIFARKLPLILEATERELRERDLVPDVLLCDFEPMTARLAPRMGVPLVTLDSQHFFRHTRILTLPLSFWGAILFLRLNCFLFVPKKDLTLISKFSPIETVRETATIRMVGPLVRDEIRLAPKPEKTGGYILGYLRESIAEESLKALEQLNCRTIVYGLGARPARGQITFKELSVKGFVDDLINADRVIGTAGSQLIGECVYLRKPLLIIPEKGHFEQRMNARLAEPLGVHCYRRGNLFTCIERFLNSVDRPHNPYMDETAKTATDLVLSMLEENSN